MGKRGREVRKGWRPVGDGKLLTVKGLTETQEGATRFMSGHSALGSLEPASSGKTMANH